MRSTLLETIGVALLLGGAAIGAYGTGPDRGPGDMNCDGVVDFGDINPFVLALSDQAAYEAAFPDCLWQNADCNGDGEVGFGDINPFVALLAGAHLGEVMHTDCWEEYEGERGWCPSDVVVLTVEGNTLHTDHQNAEYNCCFDDIVISLTVEGDLIQLDEEEIAPNPCWCLCCTEIWATVEGLASGTYTVDYCWFEYDTNQVDCYVGVIVIP
jgi:hypothetical protein